MRICFLLQRFVRAPLPRIPSRSSALRLERPVCDRIVERRHFRQLQQNVNAFSVTAVTHLCQLLLQKPAERETSSSRIRALRK